MNLFNLDLDELYLRGEHTEEGFIFKVSEIDVVGIPMCNHLIFKSRIDGELGPWRGLTDNSELRQRRFSIVPPEFMGEPWIIVDEGEIVEKSGFNIFFTGVYNPDASMLMSTFKVGVLEEHILSMRVMAGGYMYNEKGYLRPNMVLLVPEMCDYAIDGVVYGGRTGEPVGMTIHCLGLTVSQLMTLVKSEDVELKDCRFP